MTKEAIRTKLINYLEETFPLFDPDMPDETPITEHGVDSLGTTNIVVFLEEEFNVEIDDEEITRTNLGSIMALVDFITRKMAV